MTIGYHRPSKAIVSLDAITHNYFAIKKHIGNKAVMAVVKADGYGLGAVKIADALNLAVRTVLRSQLRMKL